MKHKDILIFSLVTAFIYQISELASLHGDFELYFSKTDRFWTISDFVVSYLTVYITLHFINKWKISSLKESFFTHTLTYTVIASILATVANYVLNEILRTDDISLMLTFFWYLSYKFFESCFFELYRTRVCNRT